MQLPIQTAAGIVDSPLLAAPQGIAVPAEPDEEPVSAAQTLLQHDTQGVLVHGNLSVIAP